jgi:hypothetical protein
MSPNAHLGDVPVCECLTSQKVLRIQLSRATQPDKATQLAQQLCAGLAEAHSFGVLQYVIFASIATALITWFNVSGQTPFYPSDYDHAIRGWAGAFGMVAYCPLIALINALAGVVVLLLVQLVARRPWLTISLWIIIAGSATLNLVSMSPIIVTPAALAVSAVSLFVLFRYGILGLTATFFTGHLIRYGLLTLDPSRWYFRSSALVLVTLAALAVHGFRTALAGRPVFGRAILED